MRSLPLGSALRVGLAALCAFGVWAYCVNHYLLNLSESFAKQAMIVGLALALAGLALASLRWSPPRRAGLWPWFTVLLLFAFGEARRLWLRSNYRVEATTRAELFTPVTTTALRVTHFTLRVPGLPVGRLRVVHLTDLHLSEALPSSYPARVLEQARKEKPDLLVLTGDYVSRAERLPLLASWLQGLPAARFGAFGVLGNHDYWTGQAPAVREVLRHAGVHVLTAECASVALTPERTLALCGTDAPWGPEVLRSRLQATAGAATATLVLSHTPDNVYELEGLGVTALFAGHTHGGQLRLPGLGALIVPSRYGRRFDQGHFLVGGTHLFVSAGVGADAPPLRLWCPPEILVVDLLPADSNG
jgi:predicted MPP superfamily phosphohydrolase